MTTDHNSDSAPPLDGNAVGGLLREIFVLDITAAIVTCGGCGTAAALGDVRVFGGPMGAIFRCERCDTAVMRLVHTPTGFWLDMRGARSLQVNSLH
jgi:Family of unknown function (DUF6510)